MEEPSNYLAIAPEYKNRANFSLNFISKEDDLAEIKVLVVSKAIQESGIPVKIITCTAMQIEKALTNDHLRVSKVSLKFHITTVYDFVVN